MPLVGVAAGCDLSEPSRVMGPSGSTSHTAMAMDPVHGSQWSISSTDITLTAKQGEVSTGTASTALTGQRSQPTDAARQLFIVDDTALTGHPSHLAAIHGDTPMSTGTASTAVMGQRSQPTDAARQLFIVDDTALTGHPSDSAATHEVSTGTAPSGQRGQPTEAARQPFWHGSSGPNGSTGPARRCHLN